MVSRSGGIVRFPANPGINGVGGRGGPRFPGSGFKKLTIYDLEGRLRGRRVLMRCDFNGTVKNWEIKSTTRLDAGLESIKYVLDQGASQVILLSHNGRYQQVEKEGREAYSLLPAAQYLSEKLGTAVKFIRGFDQEIKAEERVVLMENTREDSRDEAKDAKANRAYAEQIIAATWPDVFVLDGFSVSHRDQASVTWLGRLLKAEGKLSVAGALMQREFEFLIERIIKRPETPFLVFLGGSKVAGKGGKLMMIEPLLHNVNALVIGGAMAFPFLLERGFAVESMDPFAQRSGRAKELIEECNAARTILNGPQGHKLLVPTLVIGQKRQQIDISREELPPGVVMKDLMITDLLPDLKKAGFRSIFFNGTFGAYEDELGGHVEGTNQVLSFMGRQENAVTILGGGDTLTAQKALAKTPAGEDLSYTHKSTGGGASGQLLTLGFQGRPEQLPGFDCLSDR